MPIRALIVRATAFVVDSFVMAYKNVVQRKFTTLYMYSLLLSWSLILQHSIVLFFTTEHSTAIPKGETSAGAKVTQSMSSNAIDPDLATMILNVPYGTSREEFNEVCRSSDFIFLCLQMPLLMR